jgi:hypothetical protein
MRKLKILFTLLMLFFFSTQAVEAAGVYYGAYVPYYQDNNALLSDFEGKAGKAPALINVFYTWRNDFPRGDADFIRNHGSIPVISWESYDGSNPESTKWGNITYGSFDGYIRKFAQDAKAWGHPFFLRFDWEMNGPWTPYAHDGGAYAPMWRHVHDIFVQEGATNVTWVWCPNHDTSDSMPIEEYYPGDTYVDWVCMDGYNFGTRESWSSWIGADAVFGDTYNHLSRIAPSKPIMIGEVSVTEQGGDKAAWITEFLQNTLPNTFPRVKAFVWFNVNETIDWHIDSSVASQHAFAAGISSDYYAGNVFSGLEGGPISPLGGLPGFQAVAPVIPTVQPTTVIPTVKPSPTLTPVLSPMPTKKIVTQTQVKAASFPKEVLYGFVLVCSVVAGLVLSFKILPSPLRRRLG